MMTSISDSGHYHYYPADTCLMVLLRRLAFPNRFGDLVKEFGLNSVRLCEIFHGMLEYIFISFAWHLSFPDLWQDHFTVFANAMSALGSPYDNLIGIIDGNFLEIRRPGGKGNHFRNNLHQQEDFYSGKEKRHGLKFLAMALPNGMLCIHGPAQGRRHDARLLADSKWIDMMWNYERVYGSRMCFFGDAAFPRNAYSQVMRKGRMSSEERSFNSLMSRIRIHVENAFAGRNNVFNFLSFPHHVKLGGRNSMRIYHVANFLLNCRATFYGNRFSHESGIDPPSLEEFLSM
mmetsp:Transcript_16624/g.45246  ORF Transcript_16624/g.45246 Transcript_16624/m.45246 type:complete len:289 (+) Transcript_16624:424-1290(+)